MKKTKKFLSIFAILFVAIFALSCCFFAACGSKDDDDDTTTDGTTQDDGTTSGDESGDSGNAGGDDGSGSGDTSGDGSTGGNVDPGTTEDTGTTENPGTTDIDSRITLKVGEVEGNNNETVTFSNPDAETLYIANTVADEDGNVTYTLAGTASTMDSDQATDFWAGHATGGNAYIIITVSFKEDETVSWTASNGEKRKRTISDYPDGEMDVIIRISGEDLSEEIQKGTISYTITDGNDGEMAHTVNFSAVIPEKEPETSSFIVPMATEGTPDETTYEAGTEVIENSIFKLTTVGGMTYSMGKDNSALQASGNEASFKDLRDVTHKPDQGLISTERVTPSVEGSGESAVIEASTNDDIIQITALKSATVYLYISITNESFNKNMNGTATLDYSINEGQTTQVNANKRGEVMTLTLDLTAGNVVKIGMTNSTTNNDKTDGTGAAIWLFGAEAVAI